ncbi:DUF2752 domain-containing protein [Riemerella columbina]|uniref:DUF2752 domain-containing protein n=1 Tax=Riemerella columbina TaxID=103810 RepID=UPI00036BD200|nr:DUF2752 domain-containing protein [Riemerella columbina]
MKNYKYKKTLWVLDISIALAIVLWLYRVYNPAVETFFPACPSYTWFKIYCPFCGGQRALHQLLNFNFIAALLYNPLFIISLPFVFIWLYNLLFQKNIGQSITKYRYFLEIILLVLLVFTVLRNLNCEAVLFLRPLP